MIQLCNKSETNFSICFGGENEIEVKMFIDTLESTLELINYVANKEDKEAFIKINVKGTQNGSFKVHLAAIAGFIPTLININNINFARSCIDLACGMINIKKHLKGEKPKKVERKGDSVVIENIHSESAEFNVKVFNFYNQDSDKIISKIFSNCDREYFKINNEDEDLVFIGQNEYENMRKIIEIENAETEERIIINTIESEFLIKKPDLTGNSQWELVDINNNNKTIRATIEDKNFISQVHSGDIYINSKTIIKAALQIETTLNKYNESIKDVYTIKDVKKLKNNKYEQLSF